MEMTNVKRLLGELSAAHGVLGCGIVSRDGRPIDMYLSHGLSSETIAIMSATVFGAAITLQSEAAKEKPSNIIINTNSCLTKIYECGMRALVMVIVEREHDEHGVMEIVGALNREFSS
jgi:predicted regulator of Ras-like GTPase activity (Roadblock/LC7/MglB family)